MQKNVKRNSLQALSKLFPTTLQQVVFLVAEKYNHKTRMPDDPTFLQYVVRVQHLVLQIGFSPRW